MKKLLLSSLLALASVSAFAQSTDAGPATAAPDTTGDSRFSQVKQKHLDSIAKRMGHLQSVQQCVSAATDFAALRACEPKHRHGAGGEQPQNPQ